MAAAPPASASSAGHQHAVKKLQMMDDNDLQNDDSMPLAFRWVMAASSSSSLTIGEKNKENNFCRDQAWIPLVSVPSVYIVGTAVSAYTMYGDESLWGPGFPWYVPVVMLWGVYMAVVHLAMYHLTLFLPQAPYAAREALWHVGFQKIGIALGLTSGLVLFFDRWRLIAWCCIAGLLVAAVVAFWICLIRMYGDWETSIRGLARGLAVSSLLTAALTLTAFMIHPQFV